MQHVDDIVLALQPEPARAQVRPVAQAATSTELGPDEFTDPLNSIHWGAPTAEGSGKVTRYFQQLGPALMIDIKGAEVSAPEGSREQRLEKTYRFRIPVEYRGQLPSEPALTGYRFKFGGAVEKASDSTARIEISAGVDSADLTVTPESGRNFSRELFIETRDVPRPFVNRRQTMPALDVKVKLKLDRGSSNRKALLELNTLRAEPEFSWGE